MIPLAGRCNCSVSPSSTLRLRRFTWAHMMLVDDKWIKTDFGITLFQRFDGGPHSSSHDRQLRPHPSISLLSVFPSHLRRSAVASACSHTRTRSVSADKKTTPSVCSETTAETWTSVSAEGGNLIANDGSSDWPINPPAVLYDTSTAAASQ